MSRRSNGAEPAWSQRKSMFALARRNREMKDLTVADARAIGELVDLPEFEFAVWDGNAGYVKATAKFGSEARSDTFLVAEYLRRHVKLCLDGSPYDLHGVFPCTRLDEIEGRVPNGEFKIEIIAKVVVA